MHVLVTGSSGFVGQWLDRHLMECGDQVTALPADLDVTDRDAVMSAVTGAAPDAICHLAAQASVSRSWEDPVATFTVNTTGTLHVLEAAAACRDRPRVLLVSSSEVYGRLGPDELPVGEDHPFAPTSPYAASKAAAELAGLQAWLGSELEVLRVRPFNHTGPGQRPDFVVPGLARQVVEAAAGGVAALEVGNLAVRRDLTDVRDVVQAYRAVLEHGAPGEVYNVCRGESVGLDDVARRLLTLAGVDVPIVVDPARLRPADLPDLRGDPSRLHAATRWEPVIPLDQTLADVLAWWREAAG